MLLRQLLKYTDTIEVVGDDSAEVTSLTFDSRNAAPGALFFAVPGTASDGHDYIDKALDNGAIAVVCQRMPGKLTDGVAYVRVADSAAAVGTIASLFYGSPGSKLKLIGVTGTNGKTTIATLLYDMFRKLGYKAGLISTVAYRIDDREIASTHTTPDAIRLNAMMAEMVARGCDYCFMEVSSHSVVQRRIAGLKFAGGIFTNITHEHLDYHKTFSEYIRAKKLFFDDLPREAFALFNADDRNGAVMVQNSRARVRSFSLKSFADYKCRVLETGPEGMLLEIDSSQVWVRFLGRFNAYNLAAVYGAARELGIPKDEALTVLSTLTPVRGRFETIRSASGVTAIIDYAHTPDALRNVMDTINDLRQGGGKLYVVVGCGGDRDKTKRPAMARIAVEGADVAIFTSDNPRHEKPEDILADMAAGLMGVGSSESGHTTARSAKSGRWLTITDRAEAIKAAAMMARSGDIILVAGKGHETYQITGDQTRHFDDREEVIKQLTSNR